MKNQSNYTGNTISETAPDGRVSSLRNLLLRAVIWLSLTAAVLSAAVITPALQAQASSGNMRITPIDFGPDTWGDATIVSSGGRNLLMDTCNVDSYNTIINYLSTHDFYSFDIYISHYHYDHFYQVVPILQDSRFHVSTLYLPDPAYLKKGADNSSYCDLFYDGYLNIVEAASSKGIRIVYLKKGSVFTIGNAKFEVLWGCNYDNGVYDTHYINNNSLVTRVTSGDTVYLTCGDIEKEIENQLVNSGINLRADIFKFSHHGGNTSNTASFVQRVNPSFSYFNYNGDSPSTYGKGWVATSVANLRDISNIYSSRYNGMLSFNVQSGHISVAGERNMESVSVDIKNSSGAVVNTVTYQFNNADKHVITDRMKESAATVSAANASTTIPPRIKNGTWKSDSEGMHYYDSNGNLVTGRFLTVDGKTYYFDNSGVMLTGWQTIDGKKYYFESNGSMLYRWKRVDGEKYLFDYLDGHMHTGWVQENGKWYYLDPEQGYLVNGWLTVNGVKYYLLDDYSMFKGGWQMIDGKNYYFDGYGRLQTDWLQIGTLTYYLGKDGARVSGTQVIDGKTYTFNASGVLQGDAPDTISSSGTSGTTGTSGTKLTGWQRIDGKTYYYDESGTKLLRWKRIDGKKYYLDPEDGHLHTGWVYASDTGGWYYLDPEDGGAMAFGSKEIDGIFYYLDPDTGKMFKDGWATVDGSKYYYDGYGRRLSEQGFIKYSNKWYLVDSTGKMLTGWQEDSGKRYYLGTDGVMQTRSWITTNGKKYYVDAWGEMVTGTQTIDGKKYVFDNSGALQDSSSFSSQQTQPSEPAATTQAGWKTIDGKTYYFNENGTKLLRWKRIDGKKYYLDPSDGHLHTGWVHDADTNGWYYLDPEDGGAMVFGSKEIDGIFYYLDPDTGKMLTNGWGTVDGSKYYYDGYGRRLSEQGFIKYSNKWYLVDSTGKMLTGWQEDSGKWYYLGTDGIMQTRSWITTNGYKYYVDAWGEMVTGTQTIGGKTYVFNNNGALQGDSTSSQSGSATQAGWRNIGGQTYYYDESGTKLLRWKRIDGKKYYLDPVDGHLHTGWTYDESTKGWYYMDPKDGGAMAYGSVLINGIYYYLDPDTGKMLTSGWAEYDGGKYFYDGYGQRISKAGFIKYSNNWYLLNSSGKMLTGWQKDSNNWYYLDSDGVMQINRWVNTDGNWYYVNGWGVMVTGSQTIDGKKYVFDSSGALQGEAPKMTNDTVADWDNGTDSDMAYNVTTSRDQNFVNQMLTYATYFDGKISYGSSQNNTDPNNLRYERLRSGGVTDCSWFVYHVLHKFGLLKDFVHSYEWGNSPSTYPGGVNIGTEISKASPGDVLCTGTGTKPQNSHVMIYLGDNKAVECAAGHGVRITSVSGSVRQIVHFSCLPSNPSVSYSSTTVNSGVTTDEGRWEQDVKGYRYKVNSSYICGRFYTIDTITYYFDDGGYMLTGWQDIGGKTYYFDEEGALYRRWKRIDGKKYLFDYSDGSLHTGWTYADDTGGWYYLDPEDSGAMVYGLKEIEGINYYFDPSSGKMQLNTTITIDGTEYFFDGYGRMQTN